MKMLYGCPFEKIHFLSKIDTNFGFGRDFMVKVDYIVANEGIWLQKNVKFYACYQKRHFRNCQFVTFDQVYGFFCIQLSWNIWIQNLCQFWGKSEFSQKDTHTAFPFLFSSVLLSFYRNFRAKFGMYFAHPSFNVFE